MQRRNEERDDNRSYKRKLSLLNGVLTRWPEISCNDLSSRWGRKKEREVRRTTSRNVGNRNLLSMGWLTSHCVPFMTVTEKYAALCCWPEERGNPCSKSTIVQIRIVLQNRPIILLVLRERNPQFRVVFSNVRHFFFIYYGIRRDRYFVCFVRRDIYSFVSVSLLGSYYLTLRNYFRNFLESIGDRSTRFAFRSLNSSTFRAA